MKQLLFLQYLIIFQAFVIVGVIEPLYLDKIGETFNIQFIAIVGVIFNLSVFFAQLTKKLNLVTIYTVTGFIDATGYFFVYFYNISIELFIYAYITQSIMLTVFLTSYTAKFKAILSKHGNIDFEQFQYNERYLMAGAAILGASIAYILNNPHKILVAYILSVLFMNVLQILNYKNFKKFVKGELNG